MTSGAYMTHDRPGPRDLDPQRFAESHPELAGELRKWQEQFTTIPHEPTPIGAAIDSEAAEDWEAAMHEPYRETTVWVALNNQVDTIRQRALVCLTIPNRYVELPYVQLPEYYSISELYGLLGRHIEESEGAKYDAKTPRDFLAEDQTLADELAMTLLYWLDEEGAAMSPECVEPEFGHVVKDSLGSASQEIADRLFEHYKDLCQAHPDLREALLDDERVPDQYRFALPESPAKPAAQSNLTKVTNPPATGHQLNYAELLTREEAEDIRKQAREYKGNEVRPRPGSALTIEDIGERTYKMWEELIRLPRITLYKYFNDPENGIRDPGLRRLLAIGFTAPFRGDTSLAEYLPGLDGNALNLYYFHDGFPPPGEPSLDPEIIRELVENGFGYWLGEDGAYLRDRQRYSKFQQSTNTGQYETAISYLIEHTNDEDSLRQELLACFGRLTPRPLRPYEG
jgi:hypothetical protein